MPNHRRGKVREIFTKQEFDNTLAYHRESTGLPVIVDFYSPSCGYVSSSSISSQMCKINSFIMQSIISSARVPVHTHM